MAGLHRRLAGYTGRPVIAAFGALYVCFGVGYPLVPTFDEPVNVNFIIVVLVAGPGLILLAAGYKLPSLDVDPAVHPVVSKWVFGGIGFMLGLVGFVALSGEVGDLLQNVLILTAIGSNAGLAAGTYDARARSRTLSLQRRNEQLQETQAELEETIDKLEASERRYRTLAENFPNGAVALLDDELRVQLLAGRGFEHVGFDAADLRGTRLEEIEPASLRTQLEPEYRATLEGERRTFEVDVGGRTFEYHTLPLTDSTDPYAILAISQDITERKAHERDLARRAEQQRVIAELGQLALEVDDPDVLMDEAATRVAGALENEFCTVLDLDGTEDELLLRQGVGWSDGIVGRATVSASERDSLAVYTLEHDEPIVVEDLSTDDRLSGPALFTDHGVRSGISTVIGPFDEPWGILGTHDTESKSFSDEDVSFVQSVANILAEAIERQQYEEELEQLVRDLEESNQRLEQFAYAASHDLQEPLRMVSSYLQLIEQRYAEDLDEEGLEFFDFAVAGAERMRSMIDGLLQYSRVETTADPLQPVDLNDVLADVRDDLEVSIEDADATITAESLPRVLGDEHQLRQVFQNLLENAIAYSGNEPPEVTISAAQNGDYWTISVADQGIGIDPDYQNRVFEVFERLHGGDEHDGTGIGLALSQRIVERHGGDIWVDSSSDDGATFSFTLPAVDASETTAPSDSSGAISDGFPQ